MKDKTIVLWGTGIIGRRYYDIFQRSGISVEFFVDNDVLKQGTFINSIPVCSPQRLKDDQDKLLIIACFDKDDEVYNQAIMLGLAKDNVYNYYSGNAFAASLIIRYNLFGFARVNDLTESRKIAFDLQNGLALGGVESWAIEHGMRLIKDNYEVALLLGRDNSQIKLDTSQIQKIELCNRDSFLNNIRNVVDILIRNSYSTVISNFAGINMIANCYYKSINCNIRHIMVIHNDEQAYYEAAVKMEKYIDKCLVISSKMKNVLCQKGFDDSKIIMLEWKINDIVLKNDFMKNDIIRIGYAGRVTKKQKHLDYILNIVDYLDKKDVRYEFYIAGIGDYYDELCRYVENNNLQDKIIMYGMINRSNIIKFWRKQDIYFSCSDWEGHSISQSEGIAAGAVPVITDVSGARDDVVDGVTGYIVPIGDWKRLAERICYLSRHKDQLLSMSKCGTKKALEHNKNCNENLLEELCR